MKHGKNHLLSADCNYRLEYANTYQDILCDIPDINLLCITHMQHSIVSYPQISISELKNNDTIRTNMYSSKKQNIKAKKTYLFVS